MTSDNVLFWLRDQGLKSPANPDSLHPADAFPLATLSNPPSATSVADSYDAHARLHIDAERANAAALIHPPTPNMGDQPPANQARRRSSSLAGAAVNAQQDQKKHKRHRSEHIPEEGEDTAGSDSDHSDDSRSDSDDLELDDMRSEDGLEDDEETGLTGRDRRRRRRRKRRNTLLDQRIVEEPQYTRAEKKLATQNLVQSMLINALLIGLWYLFSISISVYNKWMFKQDKGDGKTTNIFPFPLFTTCLHMIVQFSLASLVLFLIPSFRPRHDALNPHGPTASRVEPIDPKKPLMTKWFYFTRIGPCGAATSMDIGLGNMSLKFITLTFFKQPSWRLVFIILIMTVGVVMMVAGEAAFDALGFILVMASACSSGFRWSLTQILLLRNPATANPFSSIFFLAPVMFISLFVLAVPLEGFPAVIQGLHTLFDERGTFMGLGILLFPGCLAFLMTSSEFALLKRTSVVTLSICGIFKEVVTITTANIVFKDPLTPINLTGLFVTIGSIAAYNYMKITKMRDEARMQAHIAAQEEYAPVSTREPDRDRPATTSGRGGLLRNSLQIAPGVAAERAPIDSPTRASPVKRPEDLE